MRICAGASSRGGLTVLTAETADPFAMFLNSTMVGGTSLVAPMLAAGPQVVTGLADYVNVRVDVILQYERTILELQRELLHYKRLLSHFLSQPGTSEEFPEPEPVVTMDAESIRVLNSIVTAHVPASAAFLDFEEGEL